MDALINITGFVLIITIIWWFWLSKPKAKSFVGNQVIDIVVEDGVYTPARIEVPRSKTITLRFVRNDASPCAEKVLFDSLNKSLELPLREPVDIELKIEKEGEYEFTCDMKMYRGALLVK